MTFPIVFAAKHRNEDVRAQSRSGGIFTAISDFIIDNGGIVYGCALDNDFNAVHIRADNTEDRNKMRGSKYIQSKLADTYRHVKIDVDSGRNVIFSGTSCQIAGLKNFLGKDYSNLLCIDIVCHGVPSKFVWQSFLKWEEKKANSKVASVDFRNKNKFGWKAHVETLSFQNGKTHDSEVFRNLFYNHSILRPSCYECPYKSIHHPGDITIADYWGIEKAAPSFNDNKGVSLVLINNQKGLDHFEKNKESVIWEQTEIENSMQPPLLGPFAKPQEREIFWSDYKSGGIEFVVRKYGGYSSFKDKVSYIKRKVKKIIRKA